MPAPIRRAGDFNIPSADDSKTPIGSPLRHKWSHSCQQLSYLSSAPLELNDGLGEMTALSLSR